MTSERMEVGKILQFLDKHKFEASRNALDAEVKQERLYLVANDFFGFYFFWNNQIMERPKTPFLTEISEAQISF